MDGFPHSAIQGSLRVCHSPWLIAAYHGLHRLRVPRHPPHAFTRLTTTICDQAERLQSSLAPTFRVTILASMLDEIESLSIRILNPRSTTTSVVKQRRRSMPRVSPGRDVNAAVIELGIWMCRDERLTGNFQSIHPQWLLAHPLRLTTYSCIR